jgi:TRAP-type C4-dicarboxylate transport system permease small subunit
MHDTTQRGAAILSVSRGIDRILEKFDQAMVIVACLSVFAIMVLIFFDAMSRYLFNHPLTFTFDIVVLYLMSATLLSILSFTLRQGGHISIDLFANLMNHRAYLVLVGFALLGASAICGIMAWEITHLAYESLVMKEIMTGVYAWPLWISKAIVALSFIGLTARLVHIGLSNLIAGLIDIPDLEIAIMHDPTDPEGEI